MYAHVTTVHGAPGRLEDGIRELEEQIGPTAQRQSGFRGAYILLDRTNSKALAIVLWTTKENLRAGEALAAWIRSRLVHSGATTAISVPEIREVAVAPPTLTEITPRTPVRGH
jgi:hypothetical protein